VSERVVELHDGLYIVRTDPACIEAWPECRESGYDPRCCRFPKSCSCDDYIKVEPDPPVVPETEVTE
jgi:hypothetical protein